MNMKKFTSKQLNNGSVGMPQALLLLDFGQLINNAFGEIPYQVGSSLISKNWRDVDVRLILSDEDYEKMGFGNPNNPWHNKKWVAMVKAFDALGEKMTGLPIDFQIQQRTYANKKFKGSRNSLFDMTNLKSMNNPKNQQAEKDFCQCEWEDIDEGWTEEIKYACGCEWREEKQVKWCQDCPKPSEEKESKPGA